MGVYIPSLKMPQTCEDCTLESYCSLWVEARRLCGETFTDAKSRIKATIRHPDCPLIEVPPHGRLIDGDKLAAQCDDPYWCAWLSDIEGAPTIIEAEPKKWAQIVCNKCGGKRFTVRGDIVVCDKCGAKMDM